MRTGIGFDVHRFVADRELILGGVKINYSLGLQGHSDADVLLHALMDALLGAVAAGDLGQHFPPEDDRYKGICSLHLLAKVQQLVAERGFSVNNVDSIIIAEAPKLAPYRKEMVSDMSRVLKVDKNRINVKATTTEGLGFTGRKEGIAARAVVSVN